LGNKRLCLKKEIKMTTETTASGIDTLTVDAAALAKLVSERAELELAPIKEKLGNAFKARDEALAKAATLELAVQAAKVEQLKAEGKDKEAAELQLAEARAQLTALQEANIILSRDSSVREAMAGLNFRSDKASAMAYKEIVSELIKNDQGVWSHKSGISIKDYVAAFSKDEAQEFLFKPKMSSGAGTQRTTTGHPGGKKSLFEYTQAEVLQMATEGKLPK
jgi:hypothetical protein